MDEFTQFINTEQGLQFVLQLSGAVTAVTLGILFICGLTETCVFDPIASAVRWFYIRTSFYKKKHEEFIATYESCRELLHDLYMTNHFESKQEEFELLIKSLYEYEKSHTKQELDEIERR